jgi:ABC-type polar amino acid transport system ATPase subunit
MAEETKLNARLSLENFDFSYKERKILNNLSLIINKGEVISILGRSGSGKSTLLKCMSTLLHVKNGNAFLDEQQYISTGELLFEPWEIRQKIILVFQEYNLFPNLSVLDNISIALKQVKHCDKLQAEAIALDMIEKLALIGIKDRYPNEISGGESQRVALARALVMKPKVLLLDEITSAIDPSTILNVITMLNEIKASVETIETSIVLVTHNIRFATDYSDRIAFMSEGVILEQHPAKLFLTDATESVTKRYIRDARYFI